MLACLLMRAGIAVNPYLFFKTTRHTSLNQLNLSVFYLSLLGFSASFNSNFDSYACTFCEVSKSGVSVRK